MTQWMDDPEGAADSLMAGVLDRAFDLGRNDTVLAAYQYGALVDRLRGVAGSVIVWNRHLRGGLSGRTVVAPEPVVIAPVDVAFLRLPKPRDEQAMALHQVLGAIKSGGRIYVYGGNDEGIRSFQKLFCGLVGEPDTVATRGHGRVMTGVRGDAPLRPRLSEWAERSVLTLAGTDVAWVSYPGVFARGALDAGTLLLLSVLPKFAPGASILDYGAGPGAIAKTLLLRQPDLRLTLLDNDSVALVAAAENVQGQRTVLGSGLGALGDGAMFDAIVSNPPLHAGVKEDHQALEQLIGGARARLAPDGAMWLVVQRRVAIEILLAAQFSDVSVAGEDSSYRVWHARGAPKLVRAKTVFPSPARRPKV